METSIQWSVSRLFYTAPGLCSSISLGRCMAFSESRQARIRGQCENPYRVVLSLISLLRCLVPCSGSHLVIPSHPRLPLDALDHTMPYRDPDTLCHRRRTRNTMTDPTQSLNLVLSIGYSTTTTWPSGTPSSPAERPSPPISPRSHPESHQTCMSYGTFPPLSPFHSA
jgi:hypothetical protein